MKKIGILFSILILAAVILYGCGPTSSKVDEQFAKIVAEKATLEALGQANEFMSKNISKLDKNDASKLLMEYEDFMLKYSSTDLDQTELDKLLVYWNPATQTLEADKIKGDQLKATYNLFVNDGFYFLTFGGDPFPTINYSKLLSEYESNISPALIDLYKIKQLESDTPMANISGLAISWGELANRALGAEKYIQKYKDDPNTQEDAIFIYQNYINTLLLGIENTPIFSIDNNQFSNDAKTQYIEFVKNNPDSVTGYVLNEYITYLKSISYKLDYTNEEQSKIFFDTCTWLVSEAGKRVTK
ncbi:MAG: hypothetical protein WCF96_08285 [Eubacteriales bacterium]